jgi:hypothetical protein
MDGTIIQTQVVDRRPECLFLSSTKVQKLITKSARAKRWTAEFIMDHLTAANQPTSEEFHIGDELSNQHREALREILFDDSPDLLQLDDSLHVSRPWDHPVDTTGQMKR